MCVSICYELIQTHILRGSCVFICYDLARNGLSITCVSINFLDRFVVNVCIHYVCLDSLHVYSLVTYAMNVCISLSRDILDEYVYSFHRVDDPLSKSCLGDPPTKFPILLLGDRFFKNSALKWCGDRPRGGRKGVIPGLCKLLALGGASWYLCV